MSGCGFPERPAKRRKHDRKAHARPGCAFERLPVEVLEQICVESENVHLLHASPHLAKALDSDHVKRQLVLQCFRASQPDELSDSERGGSSAESPWLSFTSPFTGEKRPTKELTNLLMEDWLTMPLLRRVVMDWMWRSALEELNLFATKNSISETETRKAIPKLRAVLDTCVRPMTGAEINMFRDGGSGHFSSANRSEDECFGPWMFTFPNKAAGSQLRISFLEDPWEGMTGFGYVHATHLATEPYGVLHIVDHRQESFANWTMSYAQIPPRLLRGPWTQDHGDMLKFLLDRCDDTYGVSLTSEQESAVAQGISDAIYEGCCMAWHVLAKQPSGISSGQSSLLIGCFASDFQTPRLSPFAVPNNWQHYSFSQALSFSVGQPLSEAHIDQALQNFNTYPGVALCVLEVASYDSRYRSMMSTDRMRRFEALVDRDWVHDYPAHWSSDVGRELKSRLVNLLDTLMLRGKPSLRGTPMPCSSNIDLQRRLRLLRNLQVPGIDPLEKTLEPVSLSWVYTLQKPAQDSPL